MSRRFQHIGLGFVAASLTLGSLAGCGLGAGPIPESITVTLPDGTTAVVEQGTGVASLANTTWDFFATGTVGQSIAFVRISFNDRGALEAFENNTIATEIFGSTIRFDGQRRETSQKGISYEASTFGAETSDGAGFTFEARIFAFVVGIQAGEATAITSGTIDPNDSNRMTGTFSFTSQVTLLDIPEGNIDEAFTFVATRVE